MSHLKYQMIFWIVICLIVNIKPVGAKDLISSKPLVVDLPQAISMALKHNPNMKASNAAISASVQKEKASLAARLAKVNIEYNYTRLKEAPYIKFSIPPYPAMEFPAGKDRDIKWNISIIQPLFTGFALVTKQKLAQLGVNIAELKKEQTKLDLIRAVSICYYNILLEKSNVEVAKESLDQLEAHLKDAQNFYKQGLIEYNDLLKSQVAVAAAKQRFVKARSDLDAARAMLNVLLNRDIILPIRVKKIDVKLNPIAPLNNFLSVALERRPILKELNLKLRQAELGVKLAKSQFWPQVALIARYQQEGDNLLASRNDYTNSYNSMIIVNAKWNIFSWGQTYHQVKAAQDDVFILRQTIFDVRNKIKLQVKKAWLSVRVALENIDTAKSALKQARENYRITNLQYKHQLATSTDVLDARKYLTQAETNYHQALYGYEIALCNLKRAIGN